MEELNKRIYYKYRSLDDFERFLDIIVNNRLYGAVYNTLNDPMEGKFNRDGLTKENIGDIYSYLKKTRICSLLLKDENQDFPNDYLMWSHYANSHTGCCIELEITQRYNKDWNLKQVRYENKMPKLQGEINDRIYTILSIKTPLWENEKEVRAIRIYEANKFNTNSPYYHIKVKSVYFGYRVKKEKLLFYKEIIKSINDNINIYWIRIQKTSSEYFPNLESKKM